MKATTRSAVIAALAVLAVALAAATLDSTVLPDGGESTGLGGLGGDGGCELLALLEPEPAPAETLGIPFLSELLAVVVAIAALGAFIYVLVHWKDALESWQKLLLVAFVIAAVFGLIYALSRLLTLPEFPSGQPGFGTENGGLFGGDLGEDAGASRSFPTWLPFAFVAALALVGVIAARFRTPLDDEGTEAPDAGRGVAAVGRAAGRAADRLEADRDVENEVYRAWREMTDLLNVDDPETNTAGEFATVAVEAGLGRDDVAELTRLFEDVRYGDASPSESREKRAIAVFRRIEDRYAEVDT